MLEHRERETKSAVSQVDDSKRVCVLCDFLSRGYSFYLKDINTFSVGY